jgi:DNA-binding LacI/PurR family transcriptional regulator
MLRLLDLPEPPTAVFIGSDVVALGKYLRPALTTVHLPAYDLGRQAGKMILQIMRGLTLPVSQVRLPTELVIRSSTARVKRVKRR